MPIRNCMFCTQCLLDAGQEDWSDVTPGCSADWRCGQGMWRITPEHDVDSARELRDIFTKAETCDKFTPEA